jgi:hypothetical protein
MQVEISVRIDDREVACVKQQISTAQALPLEEETERAKDRVGQVLLEAGLQDLAENVSHPRCCGRSMRNQGKRPITIASMSGDVQFVRSRYRCRECGAWRTPADEVIGCGNHRITRLLARNVCQLATVEHYTRLEQLVADQHGVFLGHDPMMQLVHDVGGAAEAKRIAEVECWQQSSEARHWPPPEVTPQRVYVSCDGIMYCTNQTEPDPRNPGQNRLIWKQMRVGCVYWEDDQERWHKRVIWGQEEDYLSFGASLYRLACRCGYREAREKIFAADGGDWCWTIRQRYFADAQGILDWYHTSEHVWACGKVLHADKERTETWVNEALKRLRYQGGQGLVEWLSGEQRGCRGKKREALEKLINYVQPRLALTEYPTYRSRGWKIGTGMIESTAKQLVGLRLKGPGMHWSHHGATAITALRAQDLNGNWHSFWRTLTLAA